MQSPSCTTAWPPTTSSKTPLRSIGHALSLQPLTNFIRPRMHASACTPEMVVVDPIGLWEGYTSAKQNFWPYKPRTTVVIDHGITTRRTGQRKLSRCRQMHRTMSCSRLYPSHPRMVHPRVPYAASPRYPHVQWGSTAYRTARFATVAWRGREGHNCWFDGGELGSP
jgi:hypothetical protein